MLVYLRNFHANRKGFTLIEILVVGSILGVVMTGLILTLNTGERSSAITQAKVDLQAKVRSIIDLITRDVRQTNLNEINNSVPGPGVHHIKFKQVTGIDEGTGNYSLSDYYIEYTYDPDPARLRLTRIKVYDDVTIPPQTTEFGDITNLRFRSRLNPKAVPPVDEDLAKDTIIAADSRKLIITIAAQSQANRLTLNFSLTEGAKIRNE